MEGPKKSLAVLVEWCRDWGVKINVAKPGIDHAHEEKVSVKVQHEA